MRCGRQARRLRLDCAIGHEQRLAEETVPLDVETAISHQDSGLLHGPREGGGKVLALHARIGRRELDVADHLDVEIEDHAEQAVSAHGEPEQIRLLLAGTFDDASVREHQPQTAHRRSERPVGNRPAMRVDAEGAGHAEIGVGLHHLRREAEGIEFRNDLVPAHAGRDTIDAGLPVHLDPGRIEGDGGSVTRQALAAHRMARRAHRDPPAGLGRRLEFRTKRVDDNIPRAAGGADMTHDRRRIESAGVIEDQPRPGPRGQTERCARRAKAGQKSATIPYEQACSPDPLRLIRHTMPSKSRKSSAFCATPDPPAACPCRKSLSTVTEHALRSRP